MACEMDLEEWIRFAQEAGASGPGREDCLSCDTENEQSTNAGKGSGVAKRTRRSPFLTWRLQCSRENYHMGYFDKEMLV